MVAYARTPRVTPARYFELERSAETKSEYHNGILVAMAGRTPEQDFASVDIITSLNVQLRGLECKVFSSNMSVSVPDCNCFYYPDASVACSQPEYERISGVPSLTNPILVVEVLSESTEKTDRDHKFFCYQTLSSLRTYVLVAQDEPLVQVFENQPNGKWEHSYYQGLEAVVPLPVIDCQLRLSDVYARVEFKPDADNPAMRIMEERAR